MGGREEHLEKMGSCSGGRWIPRTPRHSLRTQSAAQRTGEGAGTPPPLALTEGVLTALCAADGGPAWGVRRRQGYIKLWLFLCLYGTSHMKKLELYVT